MTLSYIITSKNTERLLELYSTTNLFELSPSRTRIPVDKASFEIEIKWLQKQWTSCWRSASPQGMLYFRAKNVRYDALPSWIIHFNSIFVCTLSQYCVKFLVTFTPTSRVFLSYDALLFQGPSEIGHSKASLSKQISFYNIYRFSLTKQFLKWAISMPIGLNYITVNVLVLGLTFIE